MKLTISKSELQKGLTRIQSVVEKRNTMPILANALLDASNKKSKTLTLAATDLEVGIRGSHPANIETADDLATRVDDLSGIQVLQVPVYRPGKRLRRDTLRPRPVYARGKRGGRVPHPAELHRG